MKEKLEHSALPSSDEIQLYQAGKLEGSRAHEIELIAQENPLLSEALEGYAANPAFGMLPGISAAIIEGSALGGSGAAATVVTTVKIATPWFYFNGWIIAIGVAATTAIGVVLYTQHNPNEVAQITTEQQNTNQQTALPFVDGQDSITSPVHTNSDVSILHTDHALLADKQQDNVSEFQTNVTTPGANDLSLMNSLQDSLSLAGSKAEQPVISNASPPDLFLGEGQTRKSTVAISIKHILNYKLADYTVIRENEWEKFSLDEVGVSANFSSAEEKKQYLSEHPEKVEAYLDYVTQCIQAFDGDHFELCIQKFVPVLSQYPDDVNGLFYSAMSHYKLGHFENAVTLFTKVEKNMINTFDEESMFYHAKSLKTLGLIDEANSLFVSVIQHNGFYRENALNEMK